MEWIEIDKNNLPRHEVLASNGEDFIVGYLKILLGEVICETDEQIVVNCTHFIDIHKFKPK